MGIFDKKKEETKEIIEEEIKVTEKDKLTSYIKNKRFGDYKEEFLLETIIENYIENVNAFDKCKDYIDFISEISTGHLKKTPDFRRDFYFLFISNENVNIISSLLKLALHNFDNDYISYLVDSRSYFSDNETWFARVYEVINNNIKPDTALEEDRMRLGIYPNLSNHKAEEISDMYHELFLKISNNLDTVKDVEIKLEKLKEETSNIKEDTVGKINSTYKHSLTSIKNFTDESINLIRRLLEINPSSKKEILKELDKHYNVIEWFNENEKIQERYERLLKLKNKDIVYHPKFDEVTKYVLAGNTVRLNGPSKCGKTKLVMELSNLLNLQFYNLGNVYDEDLQINGYYDFNTNYNKSTFQKAYESGGIVLMKNIDSSPRGVISSLNNIISNFSYNPYVFGDKLLTTPSKNFRLIMTNNNDLNIDGSSIDNVVNINLDYDINFETSLTKDKRLIQFLHELRNNNINITTSTIIDITKHLDLGLLSLEELLENYIISNNSLDLLKRTTEKIEQNNNYNQTLKKLLTR